MLLSIVTITYNNLNELKSTVNSVLEQSFKDFELIIIDGMSNDGTFEYLMNIDNDKVYFISETDSGIYNAMNKGLKYAKGKYCNFLNSGDYYYNKDTLKEIFLNYPTSDILFGDVIIKNKNSLRIKEIKNLTLQFLRDDTICHQCQFIKTNLIIKNNGFNEEIKIGADHDLLVRLIVKFNCSFQYFRFPIIIYDETGFSSTKESGLLLQKERVQIYNNHFSMIIKNTLNSIETNVIEKKIFFKKNIYINFILNIIVNLFVRIKYKLKKFSIIDKYK